MKFYLLDTNVFSVHAGGKNQALSRKVKESIGGIILSVVALAEMEFGWQSAPVETKRMKKQKEFAKAFDPLPFTRETARIYGYVKSRIGRSQIIGERDAMLAAHAIECSAVLVTHNTREFSRVPGLAVEDWESL